MDFLSVFKTNLLRPQLDSSWLLFPIPILHFSSVVLFQLVGGFSVACTTCFGALAFYYISKRSKKRRIHVSILLIDAGWATVTEVNLYY